jgi:hypothetical protein
MSGAAPSLICNASVNELQAELSQGRGFGLPLDGSDPRRLATPFPFSPSFFRGAGLLAARGLVRGVEPLNDGFALVSESTEATSDPLAVL